MAETIPGETSLQELVAATDSGGRRPIGGARYLIIITAMLWSLFQVYYASPLSFMLQGFLHRIGLNAINVVIDDTRARYIHLAFAIFLAYLSYPAFKRSPRHYIPLIDWLLAIGGALLALYNLFFYNALITRVGAPSMQDIIAGCIGLIILLEACRRSIGLPLALIASVFLLYNYFGQFFPIDWVISHNSGSLNQIVNQQWITTEGVFGVPVGASTKYVFLFVLFGALLDKAGAGNYFIKTAFACLGHFRGGPAKAAVVASGLTGLISGSSIANVVTTGTFTIPMMKRVGFSREKAGAVEVASSVNGQIMPPVMGAAAFLMIEYVNMSYSELITHAFLPAVISYIALVYIVHLEALKENLQGLPRADPASPVMITLLRALAAFITLLLLYFVLRYGLGWIKQVAPEDSFAIVSVLLFLIYIALLWRVSRFPDLEMDDPDKQVVELPSVKPTLNSGLHFLLPMAILIWALMVERLSPGLSAFWGTMALIFIQFTQRSFIALLRRTDGFRRGFYEGFIDLLLGLETGARNMIGIAVATATAGIIVGVVSITGFGIQLSNIVESLSMGNIVLMLLMVAIFSLILGMGLPTTANYIVVSSLMAVVIVEVGRQNGLVVPLIAVHLFVFYFGIMADVTPPVGLASFAAAAISGGDPIRTGLVAFFYSLRTALLPFLFIFNTDLLLIDVGFLHGVGIFIVSICAILAFTAATMGYFFARNTWWETIVLLLATAILFRPGFFMDRLSPSQYQIAPQQLSTVLTEAQVGDALALHVSGVDSYGNPISFYAKVPVAAGNSAEERLHKMGLTIVASSETGEYVIDDVAPDSAAAKSGLDWDQTILDAHLPRHDSLSKYWMYLVGILMLLLLSLWQRRRVAPQAPPVI